MSAAHAEEEGSGRDGSNKEEGRASARDAEHHRRPVYACTQRPVATIDSERCPRPPTPKRYNDRLEAFQKRPGAPPRARSTRRRKDAIVDSVLLNHIIINHVGLPVWKHSQQVPAHQLNRSAISSAKTNADVASCNT